MDTGERKQKFWEQKIQVRSQVMTRTFHCPVCNVPLFSVPTDLPDPGKEKKEVVVCPNGHKVKVPAFPKGQRIY